MNVKYQVDLDQGEREQLRSLSSGGKIVARRLKRVQILLATDVGIGDSMAESLGLSGSTICRIKRRFVEEGLEVALSEQPRLGGARKLSDRDEVLLVATACSAPPDGRKRWTLPLRNQCINRRIADRDALDREFAAWEQQRNRDDVKSICMFTTERARAKLAKAYPNPTVKEA